MPVVRATLWSILGAYLLLPKGTEVDLPMLPPMDKESLPNLAAFFVCRIVQGKSVPLLPRYGATHALMLVYIVSPFITALLNTDPVVAGSTYIQGMNLYDALSAVIRQFLFILPFLLGLQLFKSVKDIEAMLMVLVVAGLWYSLPMLFEVRMSPQLHTWLYGYFPHSFVQQMREGGFRPVVFIGHGLLVAFFTMCSVVAATTFWKMRKAIFGINAGAITFYLSVVLLSCKSMASIMYAISLVLLIRIATPGLQTRIAKIIVILVLLYPMMRATDWFPSAGLQTLAAEFSELRADSLKFRLDNEDLLLKHANDRALFGWGSWGRNRVYDTNSGKDISVTDGRWIIVMGEYGWVGYLAEFGLLVLPVIRCAKVIQYVKDRRERIVLGAMTLLMAISIVDLLPNASISPWTWLLAGALLGRADQIKSLATRRPTQTNIAQSETPVQVS